MKSKVYVAAHLEKNKKINGMKRDVLVLASVDEAEISQPRPCKKIVIDRADETTIRQSVMAQIQDYIASLPTPQALAGLIHKTHAHGTPHREQYRALGFRRAMVMNPDPVTEDIRFAIEDVAETRKVSCDSALTLKGEALTAAEDFFAKSGLNYVDAPEKRALMLALKIKNGSFKSRIETLTKRQEKVVARRARIAKSSLRVA